MNRILVVGAGAVGGYFGGRLLEVNRDVTFLVRRGRADQLARSGLRIRSRFGDVTISAPPATVAENLAGPFDLVLMSCKAYDLEDAMTSIAPAVGPRTAILPLLNGMRHLQVLANSFGQECILGAQCVIAATLNPEHEVVHLNGTHSLTFGELDGTISDRVNDIQKLMGGARFEGRASSEVMLDMWEKWVFLATVARANCLMRSALGEISSSPGGLEFLLRLFEECRSIAIAEGYSPRQAFIEQARKMLTEAGSPFTTSMLRDMESGGRIEADHVIGDLLERGRQNQLLHRDLELLPIAYTHLKAYEVRRQGSTPADLHG